MEMEMEIAPTTTMAVSTSVEQPSSVDTINMIPTNANTIDALPPNFQVCTHGHVCPECNSTLIVKKSSQAEAANSDDNKDTSDNNNTTSANTKNNIHRLFASTALDNESIYDAVTADCNNNDELQQVEEDTLLTSLQSAHSANLLLTALSFDVDTRNVTTRKPILELDTVCENVSYCYECKVHVVTNVDELNILFHEYNTNENEGGGESVVIVQGSGKEEEEGQEVTKKEEKKDMEWLRGSLLVSVDDAEINALEQSSSSSRRNKDTTSLPLNQADSNLSDVMGTYSNAAINTDQNSILLNGSKTHIQQQIIKHPSEFDYEYRHKVATHVMASKLGKGGYTIVDEICDDCEMPLMMKKVDSTTSENKNNQGEEEVKICKECVVCPKLLKKIAKYSIASAAAAASTTPVEETGKFVHPPLPTATADNNDDTISAIIAQARCEAPYQENKTRRVVQPDIAEAKQYVMQRQIMGGGGGMFTSGDDGGVNVNKANNKNDLHIGTNGSHDTASMTDHDSTTADADHITTGDGGKHHPGIDWDELLINGRAILSKRLNEGWVLSSTNCCGMYCKGTPLLQRAEGCSHANLDYCAVCGGSGNGEDGAYEREMEWQVKLAEMAERAERDATPDWEELVGNGRALLTERLKQGWTMSSENCCGYHCNDMPLTNIQGGPNSCVVCGGSGTGYDGAYENYKPKEIVEEERALVSQELSRLVSMGWVIRESLCTQCLMPLVAEEEDAEDELCVLCGLLPENNGYNVDGGVCGNIEEENDEDCQAEDSTMMNETIYVNNTLKEAVIAPVQTYGDDNTNDAGKRLMMGWILPDTGTCFHCHGVQMSPPNSTEIGCINRGCPSALAAAYAFTPEPHVSTGPVRLIGRGFSSNARKVEEEVDEEEAAMHREPSPRVNHKNNAVKHDFYSDRKEKDGNYYYDDCPPIMEVDRHNNDDSYYEDPSVLSDDMTQVRSVASSALGVILVRLDDAKYELEEMREVDADAEECAQKQMEITMLIEKLANAAVQMKQKEDECK